MTLYIAVINRNGASIQENISGKFVNVFLKVSWIKTLSVIQVIDCLNISWINRQCSIEGCMTVFQAATTTCTSLARPHNT